MSKKIIKRKGIFNTHKKGITILFAILIVVGFVVFLFVLNRQDEPIVLFAESAIVIRADDGTILFEKEPNLSLYPASTTKLMAVVLVFEKIENNSLDLHDMVTISPPAAYINASRAGFAAGDIVSVYDLIMAAMLPSGSDAVMALGEHIFGSEAVFVAAMNEKAQEIGMVNTFFTNSVGLDDANHHTTAYDLSILARYAILRHPNILHFTSTQTHIYGDMVMRNTNDMLHLDGITGLKTGSSPMAGSSLIFTYSGRNNKTLIFVVLSSPTQDLRRFDSLTLLEAFR